MHLLFTPLLLGVFFGISSASKDRIRWCTRSQQEHVKCTHWPSVDCVQANSTNECIQKIKLAEAEAVALFSSNIYTAGKCGLVPVMSEYEDKENLTLCRDGEANGDPSVYMVAVVKDPTLTWDTLRGKKACFPALKRTAWNVVMGQLLAENKTTGCDPYNVMYFGESCAPGADPASALCSLCVGQTDPTHPTKDKCALNRTEQYFGYNGAFRCLVENGDVSFLKHTTVFKNTDGKSNEDWARGLQSSSYRLLCTNGSQSAVTDYRNCHIAPIQRLTVMTRAEARDSVLQFLKEQQVKHGRGGTDEKSFAMFSSAQFNGRNLLFLDSTECLIEVPTADYTAYLTQDFIKVTESLNACSTPAWVNKEAHHPIGKTQEGVSGKEEA